MSGRAEGPPVSSPLEGQGTGAARFAGIAVGLAGLAFVVRLVLRERVALAALVRDVELAWLAAAVGAGLAGMAGIGLTWGAIVQRLDRQASGDRGVSRGLTTARVLRGYFVGQLGKYVPGAVWGVVGRGAWARRDGVAPPAAYGSALLSMVTAYLAACAVAAACLPVVWGLRADLVPIAGRWAAVGVGLLAPLGLIALHPRWSAPLLRLVERRTGREVPLRLPPWRASAGFVACQVPSWLLISAATWATARGLGVELEPGAVTLATCVSWVVGFLAVPVPGGLGVREAVFVSLLQGDGAVATVALAARLVFVLVDATGAGGAWLLAAARPGSGVRS